MASGLRRSARPSRAIDLATRPWAGASGRDLGALVLRLVLSVTFVAHGSQKLFGSFNGPGIDGTEEFFASIGLEPTGTLAILCAVVEFGGGGLILLGLLTPLVALALLGDMVVAAVAYDAERGFFTTGGGEGFEINLLIGGLALALVFLGAGRLSLDHLLLSRRRAGQS